MYMNKSLNYSILLRLAVFILCLAVSPLSALAAEADAQKPITLKTMGSLFFGGTVSKLQNGETFHGDHGYAQYYVPQNSRQFPIIMWHGIGQSGRSWESTPDGREGYQAILTRRDWPVYIIDQPRRGRAGYTQAKPGNPDAVPTTSKESQVWDAFRNGVWVPPKAATLFPGVQFPSDPASIEQFFRQQTPDTGEEPKTAEHRAFMGTTMAALLCQTGPSVLMTHSNSGQYGWATAMAAPELVKAIVAYEPGACVFPEGERPAEIPAGHKMVDVFQAPQIVPLKDFKKLTQMPILVVFGDNIGKETSEIFNVEVWRVASARARQFVDAVNRHGGDAQLIFLPELNMKGNTHAPFADKNNVEAADQLEAWLNTKGLDGRGIPHNGPMPKTVELTIPLETK